MENERFEHLVWSCVQTASLWKEIKRARDRNNIVFKINEKVNIF